MKSSKPPAGQRSIARSPNSAMKPATRRAPKARSSIRQLSTEKSNQVSRSLDTLSSLDIVRRIHRQDATVARAVSATLPQIARAVDAAVKALRPGEGEAARRGSKIASRTTRPGRLFYVGAGTSGRLGVLDAAECPPTFG